MPPTSTNVKLKHTMVPKTADTWVDVWLDSLRDRYRNQELSCFVQTTLSWVVALFCLVYYGTLYALDAFLEKVKWSHSRRSRSCHARHLLPLVTHPQIITTTTTSSSSTSQNALHDLSQNIRKQLCQAVGSTSELAWTSPALVAAIRNDLALRRLVSEFMMMMQEQQQQQQQDLPLYHQLVAIWPDLLRLPSLDDDDDDMDPADTTTTRTTKATATTAAFAITLVMAAHREKGSSVASTMQHAIHACHDPSAVQVVLVDAGQNEGLEDALLSLLMLQQQNQQQQEKQQQQQQQQSPTCRWGQFKFVQTNHGSATASGRGPSLNCGAAHAQGRILTFLHADTLLPEQWDQKVIETFRRYCSKSRTDHHVIVHASAFRFGHDVRQGRPCGIGAVELLGNLRASIMKLPYGDHVISIPTRYFQYLGGFPDQPIMEDYAIMDLLRKRARVLPERLHIIDGPSARCSVRRWVAFGVAYVTLVNALIVYRYSQCGWTANDVFDYYYKRPHRQKQALNEKA